MKKIKKITPSGFLDFRRITNENDWKLTIEQFGKDANLPKWDELDVIGDKRGLWLLLDHLSVVVEFEDNIKYIYEFEPGFIFDKSNVPFFKNNVLEAMIPTMVHDYNFSCHKLGFFDSNKLFYKMCKYFGLNKFLLGLYGFVINSPAGMIMYAIMKRRARFHKDKVRFSISKGEL